MIDGVSVPVSCCTSDFIAVIFELLWKRLSPRHHGITQSLLNEGMLQVNFIKRKWFHKDTWWSSTSKAKHHLWGRVPTQRATCHGETPSSNLLLVLITNRAVPPALPKFSRGGEVTDVASTPVWRRKWKMSLLYSHPFAATVIRVRAVRKIFMQ